MYKLTYRLCSEGSTEEDVDRITYSMHAILSYLQTECIDSFVTQRTASL
jgi:hypothetical protein